MFFRIFYESIIQAFQELKSHKLRSFLSLLGISIGVFCIIMVLTAVDSMKNNINDTLSVLGDDVIRVEIWPWVPEDGEYEWWHYWNRPSPDIAEMKLVQNKMQSAAYATLFAFSGNEVVQHKSDKVREVVLIGVTHDFHQIYPLTYENGRYFTERETHSGVDNVIVGSTIAAQLFKDNVDPIGKRIKVSGRYFNVIGVLEKEGQSLLGGGWDENVIIPFNSYAKFKNVRGQDKSMAVKKHDFATMEEFKDELTATIRANRRLKPKERNNFALNQLSMLSNALSQGFVIINGAGWFIGILASIVGCFGIANIMFVTVKERTNIIGVKKSLGAKKIFILTEFLMESIVLCIIGGLLGLMMVMLLAKAASWLISSQTDLNIVFTIAQKNIIIALAISITVGIIAGIVPAMKAAQMDPVEAIRS